MPYCVAVGCRNSSEKGKLMKVFPRDKKRRQLWATKVRRAYWKPTNYSCLCEDHFDDSQWEKTRVDGSRRLKCNAVPTIFAYNTHKKLTCKENKICSDDSQFEERGTDDRRKNQSNAIPTILSSPNNLGEKYSPTSQTEPKSPFILKVSRCTSNEDAQGCTDNLQTLLKPDTSLNVIVENRDPHREECNDLLVEEKTESALINNERSENSLVSEQPNKQSSSLQLSKLEEILPHLHEKTVNYDDIVFANGKSCNGSISNPSKQNNCQQSSKQQRTLSNMQKKLTDSDKRAFLNEINHQNLVIRLQKRIKSLEKRNELLKEQYLELQKFRESSFEGLDDIFNDDQKKALCREDTRGVSWSQETTEKALEIRLACGFKGYDFLLLKGYPLPSARTLRRRVQTANVQEDDIFVFDLNQEEENDKTQ